MICQLSSCCWLIAGRFLCEADKNNNNNNNNYNSNHDLTITITHTHRERERERERCQLRSGGSRIPGRFHVFGSTSHQFIIRQLATTTRRQNICSQDFLPAGHACSTMTTACEEGQQPAPPPPPRWYRGRVPEIQLDRGQGWVFACCMRRTKCL